MRVWTFIVLAVVSGSSLAQRSTTGDYVSDLGQVHGLIRATKVMEEICSRDFPATADPNRRAYEEWRKRYLPFIQEIDGHVQAALLRQAKGDPQKYQATLIDLEKSLENTKGAVKKKLESPGPGAYREFCEGFSSSLTLPHMNFEDSYPEEVTTIRRGPPKK